MGYAALRLRDRTTAQDAVQATLLTALQSGDRFKGQSSERTWLTGILKYKILETLRKLAREVSVDASEWQGEDGDFDERGHLRAGREPRQIPLTPRDSLERHEFYLVLNECLSKLPPRSAQAFISVEMDHAKLDEVAALLMIKKNNLYILLHRARKGLRGCLEKNWFAEQASNPPPLVAN